MGFVINRKGCEAKRAEATPYKEKNKILGKKTSTNTASPSSADIAGKNVSSQKMVRPGQQFRRETMTAFPPLKNDNYINVLKCITGLILTTRRKILFLYVLYQDLEEFKGYRAHTLTF